MFSRFFIERPIFATVLSIIVVLAGAVAAFGLPVEQYPTITPVQVTVTANYPGADSQTLADSVAAPIETQINGVDNMLYMQSSSSSNGQLSITVYFDLKTDPDIAQVQVQNRVNLALPRLPTAVTQNGVVVQKRSSSILMLVAIVGKGDRFTPEYIANYANVYVLDALKRVPGAGQASIMGLPDQAMRIWMNPDRMASLGVTTSDIQSAISAQNALFGAGQIGSQPMPQAVQQTFPVVTQRPFTDPRQYENIILRASQNGSAIVRVGDVARAEVGLQQYIVDSALNGQPTTYIAIYQQPGANALTVSKAVRKALDDMKGSLPEGLESVVALDTTEFVSLSIEEVLHTLVEAVILVVLVVYLFLQNLRATLTCIVAIFVSLIGTLAGMLALGFSINLLTLFGLVLAIGIVVDDAIVVVENVERNMSQLKLDAKAAAIRAMEEVTGPVVAVVLVLSAVFIPAAFLPGTTGQLYKQFAVTIVISVAISGFVALTLTPAMCALMLHAHSPKNTGFFGLFNRSFDRMTKAYGRATAWIIRRVFIALVSIAVMFGAIVFLFKLIPSSFVPNEDQGYLLAAIMMPDAASIDRTREVTDRVSALLADIKGVQYRNAITGYSLLDGGFKANASTIFIKLAPFEERYATSESGAEQSSGAILAKLAAGARSIQQGLVIPIAPPAIPGIGSTGGFEFWIQSTGAGDSAQLQAATQKFIAAARQRPELTGLSSTFRASSQQLKVTVDRDKAQLLNVPIQNVYGTIQAQFGSLIVSQFNEFSRVWNVVLQSEPRYRQTPVDVTRLYTRSADGVTVPLAALVTTSYTAGPDLVLRFNGFPASKVNGNATTGYSSGQAIAAMQEVAREVLPAGYTFAWSGLAFEETKSGSTSALAFVFGLLIVFLILAAQYESWSLPGSVMTAVPFGIIGALLATWMRGLENDVYFQIGLLVLVGLAAKNAILIVEFAVELRHKGMDAVKAAVEAGELRLRPIIMTSLAFIFGVLPLAIASGAGANARHSIGTGIIGGMIGASTLALLFVPLFYVLFDKLSNRFGGKPGAPPTGAGPDPAPAGAGAAEAAAAAPAAEASPATTGTAGGH